METALFFVSAVFLADCSSLVLISGFWVITTCDRTTVHTCTCTNNFFKLWIVYTSVIFNHFSNSRCRSKLISVSTRVLSGLTEPANLFTCLAMAENLNTCRVSSNILAHWFTLTIMLTCPCPQKKFWKRRVSLLSRKGIIFGLSLQNENKELIMTNKLIHVTVELASCIINIDSLLRTYLCDWLNLSISMHRPSVIRDVLMLPASFSRSPTLWVLADLSEPAKSHRLNLQTKKSPIFKYMEKACDFVMI